MVTLVRLPRRPCALSQLLCARRVVLLVAFTYGLALCGCSGKISLSNTGSDLTSGTLITSSSTVDFGSVAVGQTVNTNVVLTNSGSASVTITQIGMAGQFYTLSGNSNLPLTINAKSSYTVNIRFNPGATGIATGNLTITSNASNGASSLIMLTGKGVPVLSGLTCSSTSIIGTATDQCRVTLNASADSNGLGINLASNNGAVAVPTVVTIPSGANSATFTALVSPVTSGQTANLTASVGGVTANYALQLGAAIPKLEISTSSLAFGNVPLNSAVSKTLSLSSTGTVAVTVNTAVLTGSQYTISSAGYPITLAPGQTTTLSVGFNPTNSGASTGQIMLSSNSLSGTSTTITLSGTGIPGLQGLNCSSATMNGAGTDACTVSLNGAAPGGGFAVNLVSSYSLVKVPTQIVIPSGAKSASFTVTVSPVNTAEMVTLTASSGSDSKTFSLQLQPGPALSLSANSVNFGTVGVSTQASQELTLTSTGSSAVTVNSSSLTGPGFAVSGAAFPLTLSPKQTATLTLQFAPAVTGSATGQLTLSSNSVDGATKKIGITGTGVPVLTNLSCVNSAITGTGSNQCTATLNSAAASGGFTIKLNSSSTAVIVPSTVTVAAGAVSASFSATISAVNVAQAVTISANAGSVTKAFSIQLGASLIKLGISTSNLAFGNVGVGTITSKTLTLTSNGTSAVTISAATVSGIGFSVSGATFPLTLNPNQTVALTVQFDPTNAGTSTGQLTLTSNSTNGTTAIVTLSGTGVPALYALNCSSSSYSTAGTDTCTVSLNTAAATGGFAVSLVSNNSAVIVPTVVTIAAGAKSANFTATIALVSTTQTVILTASASGVSASFTLQLSSGGTPILTIDTTSLAFGNVNLNTTSTQSISLASTGSASVTVNSAAVTGTGFSLTGANFPVTIASGQSLELSVQFEPVSAGTVTGTLTFISNSSSSNNAAISLSGTGVSATYAVDLTWDAPTSSSDPVVGYLVYRSPSGTTSYTQLNSASVAMTSYTDTTAQLGQTYDYIVESVDSSGVASSPSNTATVTIPSA